MIRQTVGTPWAWKVIGVALILAFGATMWVLLGLANAGEVAVAIVSGLPTLLALGVAVFLITGRVVVTAGDGGVELRFAPIYRKMITWREIEDVAVIDASWYRFGGAGLRFRPNEVGLILGNRSALAMRTAFGRIYVVQCADPTAAMAYIAQRSAV